MDIKEATILDISEVTELVSRYEGVDMYSFVYSVIKNPRAHIYFSRELSAVMMYLPESRGRVQMHIYTGESRGKLKELKNWCISTGFDVFNKDSTVENMVNWVAESDRGLQMFMGILGSTRVGEIKGDILYCINRDDKENIENKGEV